MPKTKAKTHKGLKKRVKVTASGKIKRPKANGGHLMSGKSSKNKRKIRGGAVIDGLIAKQIRDSLNR